MRRLKLTLFFLCKTVGLFRLAQWATRRHLKILCYHGFELNDETKFRPKLFIKPEQFERRLQTLKRYGLRVAFLDQAVSQMYAHALPENTVVITIDDGFYSTATVAVPLLKKHACPATVYVTSYYVENPCPVFRLVVQYMFYSSALPELVLRNVRWTEDRTVNLADHAEAEQAMLECMNYGECQGTEASRHEICEELGRLLDTPYNDIVRSKMFHLMSPKQLQQLSDSNVSIGLHTQRHSFSMDNRQLAEREIDDNRAALVRSGVHPIDHFCYPSGEWDERQFDWLDGMGVISSTTCLPGLNSEATPRHALRRFLDGENIHQLEFEAAVSGFSDIVRGLRVPRQ